MTAALDRLLSIEVEATEARRLAGRLRFACLPTPASLEDFDYDAAAGVDRKVIEELATCRYLETATNVLLIGPPRVGKTHLSVGLARAAAHADIAPTSPPRPTSWGEVLGDNTVVAVISTSIAGFVVSSGGFCPGHCLRRDKQRLPLVGNSPGGCLVLLACWWMRRYAAWSRFASGAPTADLPVPGRPARTMRPGPGMWVL